MKLGPLIFQPKLVPKIWGGRRLQAWGRALPEGLSIGESWDLYDRPRDSALVSQGPLKGSPLSALITEFGPSLLGERIFENGAPLFPLMVKLIDAQEALSVQVHPDDDQALRMVGPNEQGKTEIWVVLEAGPGARLTAGLKPGTTPEAFHRALKAGALQDVLNEFEVKAGDVVPIPAGRVHAIGRGCLVAEIQQNSDTTWRLDDYGRLENGRPRELHISQAVECMRFDRGVDAPALSQISGAETLLFDDSHFKVSRIDLSGRFRPAQRGDRAFQVLTVLSGAPALLAEAPEMRLEKGQTVLLPASLDWEIQSGPMPASLLWSRP